MCVVTSRPAPFSAHRQAHHRHRTTFIHITDAGRHLLYTSQTQEDIFYTHHRRGTTFIHITDAGQLSDTYITDAGQLLDITDAGQLLYTSQTQDNFYTQHKRRTTFDIHRRRRITFSTHITDTGQLLYTSQTQYIFYTFGHLPSAVSAVMTNDSSLQKMRVQMTKLK